MPGSDQSNPEFKRGLELARKNFKEPETVKAG